ncbi:hypothetical protein C1646_757007 [Rhizophagus diaphanus]|nr:hypothetical protein C1646_757007 [Rhizophagus diaphanus] [Rhizophagus sp. MUCL 43196]
MTGHNRLMTVTVAIPTRIARLIGITEVKVKNFKQGIARNAVQCESVVASIVTDEAIDAYIRVSNQHGWAVPQGWSAKALIIKCSLDNNENQKFIKTGDHYIWG